MMCDLHCQTGFVCFWVQCVPLIAMNVQSVDQVNVITAERDTASPEKVHVEVCDPHFDVEPQLVFFI